MAISQPRILGQRVSSGEATGKPHSGTMSFSASKVSSDQLKKYLESNYPGRYAIQLRRDKFTVTIQDQTKPTLVSICAWHIHGKVIVVMEPDLNLSRLA
ncbi:hypothetical protein GGS26DRAFT_485558 [Hypomontagnella submonticulosa]|nr:hypothetical protein GGS26DRAFT_485558 [Hypomontagnella submonticulosa]